MNQKAIDREQKKTSMEKKNILTLDAANFSEEAVSQTPKTSRRYRYNFKEKLDDLEGINLVVSHWKKNQAFNGCH